MGLYAELLDWLGYRWLRVYRRNARLTVVVTLVAVCVSVGAGILVEKHDRETRESKIRENLTYYEQLRQLDQVRAGLADLISFVDLQKKSLKEAQEVVEKLQKERESLSAVVEAEREVVEAIFRLQSERSQREVWRERGLGFVLAVFASVLASFLYRLVRRARRTEKVAGE